MTYRNLDRLKPEFREKVELWLADNPHVFVTESWRSRARQLKLYAQGRSTVGNIVTWTLKSKHMLGEAIDIGFKGKELYPKDEAKWRNLADSAKEYGIDWMYDLNKKEKCHFQDNGKPLREYPRWAEDAIMEMEKARIQTDPMTDLKDLKLYHLMAIVWKFIRYIIASNQDR